MTTSRLAILLAVLLGGLSAVFLLPQQLGYQPVGVVMELPRFISARGEGLWGKEGEITEQEKEVLSGSDFARKIYTDDAGNRVLVSIVLAGQDMMTGIHRPERCLQAQGWNPGPTSTRAVRTESGRSLGVSRVLNERKVVQDGKAYSIRNIAYYWFIGHTDEVATHERRVMRDAVDRILRGYNQRWAMVLVSTEISENFRAGGLDEASTDRLLQDVIAKLEPKIIGSTVQ